MYHILPYILLTAELLLPFLIINILVKIYRRLKYGKSYPASVTKVTDGDTIKVKFRHIPPGFAHEEKIRLIGVDTPETKHPTKKTEYYGKEAAVFTKNTLLNKKIKIIFDPKCKRDFYGRVLAYVHIGNSFFNKELIKKGFANVYTRQPFKYEDWFLKLEKKAKRAKKGLWKKPKRFWAVLSGLILFLLRILLFIFEQLGITEWLINQLI